MLSNAAFSAFLTLPFVSILHFLGFDFASISVVITCIVGVYWFVLILPRNAKVKKNIFYLIFSVGLILLMGVGNLGKIVDFELYVKALVSFIIGSLSIVGFAYLVVKRSKECIHGLIVGCWIFCVVGLIEILCIIGLLPEAIKEILNLFFSGQYSSRVQVTSFEPSVASRICVFYFFIMFLEKKRPVLLALLLLISISTVSILGMLVFLSGISFIAFRNFYHFIKNFLTPKMLGVIAISFYALTFSVKIFEDSHAVKRFKKGVDLPVSSLLYIDGSVSLRLISPYIAFLALQDNPMGVGFGQFPARASEYESGLFTPVISLPEVNKAVSENKVNSQSIIARILVESGWVAGLFFLFSIWLRFRAVLFKRNIAYYLFGAGFGMALQTSSYVFPYLTLCFVLALCPPSIWSKE